MTDIPPFEVIVLKTIFHIDNYGDRSGQTQYTGIPWKNNLTIQKIGTKVEKYNQDTIYSFFGFYDNIFNNYIYAKVHFDQFTAERQKILYEVDRVVIETNGKILTLIPQYNNCGSKANFVDENTK